MKKLFLLLIIPFLSFGQCIDGDFDNDGICDEFDNCVGTEIVIIVLNLHLKVLMCNSYSGCEWIYSWGGGSQVARVIVLVAMKWIMDIVMS